MAGRLRMLGQRVLARHAPTPHVGGLRLAQHVVAARTPERIVESSTRLARGRSIATPTVARAAEAAAVPKPAGMSDFAARWIFGDGPPEGIPIAGEAALADMAPAERPSFLVEKDERTAKEALAAKAEQDRRSQPVPRGRVDEVGPGSGFKLSRRPAPAPAVESPPPSPAAGEAPPAADDSPAVTPPEAESAQAPPAPAVPEPSASRTEVPRRGTSSRRGRPSPGRPHRSSRRGSRLRDGFGCGRFGAGSRAHSHAAGTSRARARRRIGAAAAAGEADPRPGSGARAERAARDRRSPSGAGTGRSACRDAGGARRHPRAFARLAETRRRRDPRP